MAVAVGLLAAGHVLAQGTGFAPPPTVVDGFIKWLVLFAIGGCIISLIVAGWHSWNGRFDKFLNWLAVTGGIVAGAAFIGILVVPAINSVTNYLRG